MTTLANLLDKHPVNNEAIVIPGNINLSYGTFSEEIESISELLVGAGLEKGRAVSLVLENNLEFMVTFLAVVRAGGIAAPLNPSYTADEFNFFVSDANSQFMIVPEHADVASQAAKKLNVPVLVAKANEKGRVSLSQNGSNLSKRIDPAPPNSDDIALFLHTSGTTSRPKGVPLTHNNLVSSLKNIVNTYALGESDTSLIVMPLFHVHGLIGAALSSLQSGGTIVIPPRFSASTFWKHQKDTQSTWYSAVPTIHQILGMRADQDDAPHKSFRFIRSCSAALAPSVLESMEERFGAPVLEAYGMTEASHQMSSNHLPPGLRTPGTVGSGTGVEITIMDETGKILGTHERGEVVIQGPNVTLGYHNNPQANQESFTREWFRTGDQGTLSEDGILTLTGRLKELINRGGEKISPLEVDAALIKHTAVAEAVCFGIPDQKYGEIVQAAVVLNQTATEIDLQAFCSDQLADFKVPERIHILEEMPRTATGKIQRRNIAAKFTNTSEK